MFGSVERYKKTYGYTHAAALLSAEHRAARPGSDEKTPHEILRLHRLAYFRPNRRSRRVVFLAALDALASPEHAAFAQ